MNRSKFKSLSLIFMVIGIILFCPIDVSAKDVLVTCNYQSDDSTTSYTTTIYDNYDLDRKTSRISFWKSNYSDQEEKFKNWGDLKPTAKDRSVDEVCPSYAIVAYHYRFGANEWLVWGFYSSPQLNAKESDLTSSYDYKIVYSTNNSKYSNRVTGSNGANTNNSNGGVPNTSINGLIGDEVTSCEKVLGSGEGSIAELLQMLFNYVKVLGPILVILFSAIDFTKTVMASDDKAMKESQKKLGIRLICAVGLYFLPLIATLLINLVFGTSGDQVCGIK